MTYLSTVDIESGWRRAPGRSRPNGSKEASEKVYWYFAYYLLIPSM